MQRVTCTEHNDTQYRAKIHKSDIGLYKWSVDLNLERKTDGSGGLFSPTVLAYLLVRIFENSLCRLGSRMMGIKLFKSS